LGKEQPLNILTFIRFRLPSRFRTGAIQKSKFFLRSQVLSPFISFPGRAWERKKQKLETGNSAQCIRQYLVGANLVFALKACG